MAAATPIATLLSALMVLTAFRLPALMMFRGLSNPFQPRRANVMIVRMPASRMSGSSQNSSQPQLAIPQLNPMSLQQQQLPFVPFQSMSRVERLPPNVTPQSTNLKPILIPTPYYLNKNMRIPANSINNRPYYELFKKNRQQLSTTTANYNQLFNSILRPFDMRNKGNQQPGQYITQATTIQNIRSHRIPVSVNEHRYGMSVPLNPRNFNNDDSYSSTDKTLSETTTYGIISTTVGNNIKSDTVFRQTSVQSIGEITENSKKINPTKSSNGLKEITTRKARIRLKRIKSRTTTTTTSTVSTIAATETESITPAPIDNYRPVKARVKDNLFKDAFEQQLMFDDTKNIYYYVTINST